MKEGVKGGSAAFFTLLSPSMEAYAMESAARNEKAEIELFANNLGPIFGFEPGTTWMATGC